MFLGVAFLGGVLYAWDKVISGELLIVEGLIAAMLIWTLFRKKG